MSSFAKTLLLVMLAILVAGPSARADSISYTGAVATFDVTTTGTYVITAAGAQGGSGVGGAIGGSGAVITADAFLTAGTMLQVVVGGMGETGNFDGFWGGGGGGGTFIFLSGATQPLSRRWRRRWQRLRIF
jgi:hypothetical protein